MYGNASSVYEAPAITTEATAFGALTLFQWAIYFQNLFYRVQANVLIQVINCFMVLNRYINKGQK